MREDYDFGYSTQILNMALEGRSHVTALDNQGSGTASSTPNNNARKLSTLLAYGTAECHMPNSTWDFGTKLPQTAMHSTLNLGGGYIQEKREHGFHGFTTHSDNIALPVHETHFSWDIQAAQHLSWH